MIVTMCYKFTLNGEDYEVRGVDMADTLKEQDILEWDAEECKADAICHAFDLMIWEYEERAKEFENAQFKYLSLSCGNIERDVIL